MTRKLAPKSGPALAAVAVHAVDTGVTRLPRTPAQAVITVDRVLRNSLTQSERDALIAGLFLGLTKAVKCGAQVDLRNPERIVVTKESP